MFVKIAKIIGILILLIIVLVITSPYFVSYRYETSNREKAWRETNERRGEFAMIQEQFEKYKNSKNDTSIKLCRTFTHTNPKYLHPFMWIDHFTHPRWGLPYIEPRADNHQSVIAIIDSKE